MSWVEYNETTSQSPHLSLETVCVAAAKYFVSIRLFSAHSPREYIERILDYMINCEYYTHVYLV